MGVMRAWTTLVSAIALLGVAAHTRADTPTSAVTGNVAVTTDYMFRGLTQTRGRPAIQGGADYTGANGFAAGFWASGISQRSYPGGAMELDLYGSYGRAFAGDWSWRAGLYGYVYPGANLDRANPPLPSRSLDTLEANLAVSWKWLTLKYNRALTDYFGADVEEGYRGDSRGTEYFQLDAALPLAGNWRLALHAGHTHYSTALVTPLANGARSPDYSDFGATLKYPLNAHCSLSGGVTRATHAAFYRRTASLLDPDDIRDVGGSRGFVMLLGNF
jgi:uncharacterized protein (TIGR02001 family)